MGSLSPFFSIYELLSAATSASRVSIFTAALQEAVTKIEVLEAEVAALKSS